MSSADEKTDTEIRSYLLGEMSSQEQSHIEERLVTDGEYFERVELAEHELIEAYLRKELSAIERARFESHFLSAPERRQRLEMSRVLRATLLEDAETRTAPAPVHFPSTSKLHLRWLAVAASLLICLGAVGMWALRLTNSRELAVKQEREQREQLAAQGKRIEELQQELNRERTIQSENRQPSENFLAFLLKPDLVLRGKSSQPTNLVVDPKTRSVQLRLAIEAPANQPYAAYRAELTTASGSGVLETSRLVATGWGSRRIVALTVPADLLVPRQYRITLWGKMSDGEFEELGTYSFRIARS
jgi:hypothetical protein